MNFTQAQHDMRKSYIGGAPGAFASGLVWLSAGLTAYLGSEHISVLVFFFGGMLIHPLGILFSKALKRSGKHQKDNPLSVLAMESTFLIFIGLFIAFFMLQYESNWFYPVMALIIGGRYLMFNSLYGMKLYWLFGVTLIIAGVIGIIISPPFQVLAISGGVIEILFAAVILKLESGKHTE
ncbi:MAG: hypothetical protein BM564_01290 [Bacteroidetes bacterium MedPE-SWsnd-G2]|nr:MAG: hypothetical protein BM564_01290 [Bacteroidetes bacterium MedPE-SWsnd-G2]